jgi:hypothetical protein
MRYILVFCLSRAPNKSQSLLLTSVLGVFHRALPHLSDQFCVFWLANMPFGILTAPKNAELATKSATIRYEIHPKLRLLSPRFEEQKRPLHWQNFQILNHDVVETRKSTNPSVM